MNTIADICDALADIELEWHDLRKARTEYDRLLAIMGNVDGPEIMLLHVVALANVKAQLPIPREQS